MFNIVIATFLASINLFALHSEPTPARAATIDLFLTKVADKSWSTTTPVNTSSICVKQAKATSGDIKVYASSREVVMMPTGALHHYCGSVRANAGDTFLITGIDRQPVTVWVRER